LSRSESGCGPNFPKRHDLDQSLDPDLNKFVANFLREILFAVICSTKFVHETKVKESRSGIRRSGPGLDPDLRHVNQYCNL
jgi:hypothetical protein